MAATNGNDTLAGTSGNDIIDGLDGDDIIYGTSGNDTLLGGAGIHQIDVTQTTYLHFMFERHEVVLLNGCWSESFQPGDYSLKGIGKGQRAEIFELFPELSSKQGLEGYQSARKSLKKQEALLLFE